MKSLPNHKPRTDFSSRLGLETRDGKVEVSLGEAMGESAFSGGKHCFPARAVGEGSERRRMVAGESRRCGHGRREEKPGAG